MSIKIMSWVWDHGPSDGTETLVLLALADFCDDDGRCYPSMRRIAEKARMQERSARRVIRRLEDGGWISVNVGNGRKGCSQYQIMTKKEDHVSLFSEKKGDRQSLFIDEKTRTNSPPDPQSPGPTVQKPGPTRQKTRTGGSPEPSGTVNNRQQSHADACLSAGACAKPENQPSDQTTRERLLSAIGADPISGMMGPNGAMLGRQTDMQTAAGWSDLGLTIDQQCRIIGERMANARAKAPHFVPRSFAYFTGAMQDAVSARSTAGAAPRKSQSTGPFGDPTLDWIARQVGKA